MLSHAAPRGGGFHGGSFRSGFVAHSAGSAFRMGSGIRRNFGFRPAFAFQTAAKGTQTSPRAQAGAIGNLVLVSWLEDAGKDVIYVQNTETNDVQKITSEPNLDNFRIVELHPNADPKLFEAVISNGSQQGPVRFRF